MEARSREMAGTSRRLSKIRYREANATSVARASAVVSRPRSISGGLASSRIEIAKANHELTYLSIQTNTRIPSKKYDPTEITIPERTSPMPVLLTSHTVRL